MLGSRRLALGLLALLAEPAMASDRATAGLPEPLQAGVAAAPVLSRQVLPAVAQPPPMPLPTVEGVVEGLRIQEALSHEVPHLVVHEAAADAAWITLTRAAVTASGMVLDHPQLLVVVDRNPRVQRLALIVAAPQDEWRVLGGVHVSTGSMGRFDHYITPRGVFHVTPAILGFRAEGTLNENGIRGLGAKGMRVWDFGWQVATKGWSAGPGKPDSTPIRLMMHATDPDKLEQRIGQPASQGCIRIPSAMNRFLDNHGVLDAEYEQAAVTDVRFRSLLPSGRHPTALAGNTLVVIDSADKLVKVAGTPAH